MKYCKVPESLDPSEQSSICERSGRIRNARSKGERIPVICVDTNHKCSEFFCNNGERSDVPDLRVLEYAVLE
jgi:hypothetical protein